ncbi:hypothetical protein [Halohasta litchfieldiae]|uniref:hypothetical protein n=1 Tax=Halohasta litchfieldiae TaxID=1073996 RepID=UPI000B7D021E|nr:hypothetical protein [Halohasta litchfieldiae]
MGAVRIDMLRLHETWMEVIFPRQLNPGHVLGKWKPETGGQKMGYYLWALLGALPVLIGYPLLLVGFGTRYYAGKLDSAATRLGIVGAILLSVVVWGGLSVVARFQLSFEGFLAVLAASGVATVAAAAAVFFSKIGGRFTSILLAYPSAMTALFLPPVVAALYSPTLASIIFPNSEELAIFILDSVLAVGGINEILRERFALEGVYYALMWFGLAVPLGWGLGVLVTFANLIRPKDD